MFHWFSTAFHTYVLHPLRGSGYQFWSGLGSDVFLVTAGIGLWRHVNCEQTRCLRPGHRHPDHGRPVCRRHYQHDLEPKP